jgi:hypothetical protein
MTRAVPVVFDQELGDRMQYSRQHVVDVLHTLRSPELADEALRDLPDPVDINRLEEWMMQHGLSREAMVSQMGGSP